MIRTTESRERSSVEIQLRHGKSRQRRRPHVRSKHKLVVGGPLFEVSFKLRGTSHVVAKVHESFIIYRILNQVWLPSTYHINGRQGASKVEHNAVLQYADTRVVASVPLLMCTHEAMTLADASLHRNMTLGHQVIFALRKLTTKKCHSVTSGEHSSSALSVIDTETMVVRNHTIEPLVDEIVSLTELELVILLFV